MKLYELLSRVTFDSLVPILNTLIIKENQLPYFKMAFDELRMMAPTINDDIIDVQMAESYIYVDGCQDRWSNVLGKNITLDDELKLADQVLAAHILWEITFFGFSEEEMKANIGRDYGDESHTPDNIYRRKIQNIEDRQWKNYSRGAQWKISAQNLIICLAFLGLSHLSILVNRLGSIDLPCSEMQNPNRYTADRAIYVFS